MSKSARHYLSQGFTLIELLVVIAIISILAVVVFVALDPVTRFRDARNARRTADVQNYLTAIHQCIVDNKGSLTPCVGTLTATNTYEIVSSGAAGCDDVCTGATSDSSCADLDTNLAKYLKTLPLDPGGVATGHTEYSISIDANNLVTIRSCAAEGSTTIEASR
ncbi:MAG TPA: type II secretion system protein [Vitreimonas sp.]|nr:type II secretion system protein [Vitreimonas sp.]